MPPEFELSRLDCRVSIDYLTVIYQEKRRSILPTLDGTPKWHRTKGSKAWNLTIHDPTPKDIKALVAVMGNPVLFQLELYADFSPRMSEDHGEREKLLADTYVALAARFRPEDMTPWGYGPRGGLTATGQAPLPFHQRLPTPDESLIYGRRGDYLQSKLYLKRVDQGAPLSLREHRVRLELTMRRGALMTHFTLDRLSDLIGYPFRATFTKHFRIVAGPRLRLNRRLEANEQRKRELRMSRAWATAGVGKFAVSPELPFETNALAAKQIRARSRRQLPMEHYVLVRDQAANAKIGDAFKNLERRMR